MLAGHAKALDTLARPVDPRDKPEDDAGVFVAQAASAPLANLPLAGEMSGRTEGGIPLCADHHHPRSRNWQGAFPKTPAGSLVLR